MYKKSLIVPKLFMTRIINLSNQGRIQDFPLGGANLQHRRFSVKTYVKTKEFGPVGGVHPPETFVCRSATANTQFRYQLVFFILIYGYIWLAEGCLWHLLPRQNLQWHLLSRENMCSGMFCLAV